MSPHRVAFAMFLAAVAVYTTTAGGVAQAATCLSPEPPGAMVRETPWPQTMLAPERAWPFSTGRGVTVAVVDAGTDARHPQLAGAVDAGYDFVERTAAGNTACVARGTAIAGIIAGRGVRDIGFRGFAPGARILPVRIADTEMNDNQLERPTLDPDDLARGIRWAVNHDAQIINVSVALYSDSRALRNAVNLAHDRDVLIVAPVGDNHGKAGTRPFPASYATVLGVGAIDAAGMRVPASQVGDTVDLVAPGDDVLGATLSDGYQTYTGTGFATAFVSATAALVRAAHPDLDVAQVHARLRATASPSVGGGRGPAYGAGIVDPYRAVTETIASAGPAEVAPLQRRSPDLPDAAFAARTNRARVALGIAAMLALATVVAAVCWPRGQRRRWRPGHATGNLMTSLDDDIASSYRAPLTTTEIFAAPSSGDTPKT